MVGSKDSSTTRSQGKSRSSPSRSWTAWESKNGSESDGRIYRQVNWYDIVLQLAVAVPLPNALMHGGRHLMTAAALSLPFHVP